MSKLIFKIEGMDCKKEIAILKGVLGPLLGGREDLLNFDLASGKMTLDREGNVPTETQVIQAIQQGTKMKAVLWQEPVATMEKKETVTTKDPAVSPLVFRVEGMDCKKEVEILKSVLGPLLGGKEDLLSFDLPHRKLTVNRVSDVLTEAQVIQAIQKTKMKTVVSWQEHVTKTEQKEPVTTTAKEPGVNPLVVRVEGMDCKKEIAILKGVLGPLLDGREDLLGFDLPHRKLIVNRVSDALTEAQVIQAIQQGTQMKAAPWQEQEPVAKTEKKETGTKKEASVNKLAFKIKGMDCADEVADLKRALNPLLGGKEDGLSFDLISEKMTVDRMGDAPTEAQIIQAVQETGMEALPWQAHLAATEQKTAVTDEESSESKLIFKIQGMDCADEVADLKRVLSPLVGGQEERLSFDLISAKMTVDREGGAPTEAQIIKAIQATGMKAVPWKKHVMKTDQKETFFQKFKGIITTAISAVGLAIGFTIHSVAESAETAFASGEGGGSEASGPPPASIAFYATAVVAGGVLVFPKAVRALRKLRPNTELLMTTAVIGAMAINQWFEAGAVTFLFSASLVLEKWNIGRARKAIRGLMELAPPTARVVEIAHGPIIELVEEGEEKKELKYEEEKELKSGLASPSEVLTETPVEDIPVGAVIVVNPGEKIPMDSVLISGEADVNQAPVTGESMPVRKKVGEQLFAGSINGDHAIRCRVTKLASDSTLAHIVRMVEEAQSRRSRSEQVTEKFARYYTPSMMLLSLVVAVVMPLALDEPFKPWIYEALTLLVISCPCALVISTPVTVVAGLAAAARAGVLIKGGVYLEAPAHIKAFAMDKTGTLTTGEPTVQAVIPLAGHNQEDVLKLVFCLETHSDHPLARAIRREAKARGIASSDKVEDFQVIKGKGAEGTIKEKSFWIGSPRFLKEKTGGIEPIELKGLEEKGYSIVALGSEQEVYGLIGIADAVRAESKAAMHALKQAGVQRIVMLTGDNKGTAKAIAELAGIDEYRAELLPADKVSQVEALMGEYKQVAMVGDGINDTPAMAASSLGIAMGAAGSDAAIETADIALMSDNLEKLPWLVRHSRRTIGIIKQNIAISLSVKGLFVGLAFAGKASLWLAIAADMGTSFLVVFNGLRLLHDGGACKPRKKAVAAIPLLAEPETRERVHSREFLSLPSKTSDLEMAGAPSHYGSPMSSIEYQSVKVLDESKEPTKQSSATEVETTSSEGVTFHYSQPIGSAKEKEKEESTKAPGTKKPCCNDGCKSKGTTTTASVTMTSTN